MNHQNDILAGDNIFQKTLQLFLSFSKTLAIFIGYLLRIFRGKNIFQ